MQRRRTSPKADPPPHNGKATMKPTLAQLWAFAKLPRTRREGSSFGSSAGSHSTASGCKTSTGSSPTSSKRKRKREKPEQNTINLVQGYDGSKQVKISCTIDTVYENTEETEALNVLPYLRLPFLDDFTNNTADVHRYINSCKWRRWKPDAKKSGTTWIEMLIRFDLMGYRSTGSIQKKDDQAHQRFSREMKRTGGDWAVLHNPP